MRPNIDFARRPAFWIAASLQIVALSIVGGVLAQNALPPGYRAYPLRNRQAQNLAPQLRTMLSGMDGETQVLIDNEEHRRLVQGSARALQLSSQFIQGVDQAVRAPTRTRTPKQSVPA